MMALMPFLLLCAVGPVTYAVKLSTNAIAPLYVLMRCCTKSALEKRKRIGDRGDSCSKPACSSSRVLEVCPLTWIDAVCSEQNASTYCNSLSSMSCAFILYSSLSLHTLAPPLSVCSSFAASCLLAVSHLASWRSCL